MAVTITFYETADLYSNATDDLTGVSWSDGDFIVVAAGNANASFAFTAPTNANLTFTEREARPSTSSTESGVQLWTAPCTSTETAQTITCAVDTNGGFMGWVISPTAGETLAFGSSDSSIAESNITLVPTADDVVISVVIDWNASNPPGLTAQTNTGTVTERLDEGDGANLGYWVADWNGVDAGSDGWGPTSYTGIKAAQVACVVAVTAATAALDQAGYRVRTDTGATEGSPTWAAAQNTKPTIDIGDAFGIRHLVQETGGADPAADGVELFWRRSGDASSEARRVT